MEIVAGTQNPLKSQKESTQMLRGKMSGNLNGVLASRHNSVNWHAYTQVHYHRYINIKNINDKKVYALLINSAVTDFARSRHSYSSLAADTACRQCDNSKHCKQERL